MSNIKLFQTMVGVIIAEADELLTGGWRVTNPCLLGQTQQGMTLRPMTEVTEDKTFTINPSIMIFEDPGIPDIVLRNEYSKIYGSGIVEVPAGTIITK